MKFETRVAEVQLGLCGTRYVLFGRQNLLNTDLINKVLTFQVGQMGPLFVVGEMRPNPLRHDQNK